MKCFLYEGLPHSEMECCVKKDSSQVSQSREEKRKSFLFAHLTKFNQQDRSRKEKNQLTNGFI